MYAHLIDDAHDDVRAALEGWQGGEDAGRTSWRRPRAI